LPAAVRRTGLTKDNNADANTPTMPVPMARKKKGKDRGKPPKFTIAATKPMKKIDMPTVLPLVARTFFATQPRSTASATSASCAASSARVRRWQTSEIVAVGLPPKALCSNVSSCGASRSGVVGAVATSVQPRGRQRPPCSSTRR